MPTSTRQTRSSTRWRAGCGESRTPGSGRGRTETDPRHAGHRAVRPTSRRPCAQAQGAALERRPRPQRRDPDRATAAASAAPSRSLAAPAWITFPGAAQIAQLRRTVTTKAQDHRRGGLRDHLSRTPAAAPPATLATWVQGHWGIENRLHWVRDVTFDEDNSQIRTGQRPTGHGHPPQHRDQPAAPRRRDNIAEALRHHARNPTDPSPAADLVKRDFAVALGATLASEHAACSPRSLSSMAPCPRTVPIGITRTASRPSPW